MSEHIVFVIATATTTFLLGMDKTKQNLCQVTRKMYLKEQLTLLQCGTRSVAKFLYELKTIADELAIIDSDANEFDMAIPSLNGVVSEQWALPLNNCSKNFWSTNISSSDSIQFLTSLLPLSRNNAC